MVFCKYVTQVYEIAKTLKLIHVILYMYVYEIIKNIKVKVCYSVRMFM